MKNRSNKKNQLHFTSLLNRYARPLWKYIAALIVITLLGNIFTTFQPVIISGVINIIMEAKGGSMNPSEINREQAKSVKIFDLNHLGALVDNYIKKLSNNTKSNIWVSLRVMSGLFLLIVFLSSLLGYLALLLSRWIRSRSTQFIRSDILKHLLSLHIGFFNDQKSGELISRIMQDAENTAQGVGPLVQSILHQGSLIIIYSIFLFSTSMWLTMGAIGMILLQFGVTGLIKKPIRRTVKSLFDSKGLLSATLQETFTSIRVIKSFSAEKYEMVKLEKDIDQARRANFREGAVRHIEPNARLFLDSIALIGILLIATIQLMNNSISIQGFILFVFVGRLLITPINKFAVNITWIQAILASFERLNELFNQNPKVKDGSVLIDNFKRDLVLKRVEFSYGKETVIRGLSLKLKKGEIIAIIGSSGTGKSTLMDLILRLYDPDKGEIFIDGTNLKKLKIENYRKIFGVVPQESLLFNDTIANNIRYGREYLTDEDVINAAKTANAHDFIKEQPKGYNTVVGDRGVRLSGGQRQRIAIARSIASKPYILILDEATSSLDTESEKQVQTAIDHILENSTAIVIAHRLSTIMHADKIVVMNNGKIEATGKHKELLKRSKTYHRFYNLQYK